MVSRLDSPRVLVVDPDGRSRLRASSILVEDGFAVEESDDYLDIVDRFVSGACYDVIVTEAGPNGEGEVLARRVSLMDPAVATVLIGNEVVITGPEALRAIRSGAFDVLGSGFSSTEFRQVIQRAAARRKLLLRDRRAADRIEKEIQRREAGVLGLREFLPGATLGQTDRFLRAARRVVDSIEAADSVAPSGHGVRVEGYATFLGRESGRLDEQDVFYLAVAALFHDIGKVRSEDRYAPAHAHPVVGGRMVRALGGLNLERSIRHHHERFDGAGFPEGLRGDEIPFEAQLLAVADSFDHMTCPRPGAESLTAEEAVEELLKGSGSQFAPAVVDLVRKNVRAMGRADQSDLEVGADFARAS